MADPDPGWAPHMTPVTPMPEADRPPDDWAEPAPAGPGPRRPARGRGADRPVLDPAAEALRTLWIETVRLHHARRTGHPSRYNSAPRWDGGACPTTGRSYKIPVWPKLVAQARAAGYPPAELVRVLFETRTVEAAPLPYELTGDENVARVRQRRAVRRTLVEAALRAEEGMFRTGVWGATQSTPDPDVAQRFVLNDQGRELSPLFRYAVAVLRGYADVAARWRDAAEVQLAADPDLYLLYWAAILPPDMREAARRAVGDK